MVKKVGSRLVGLCLILAGEGSFDIFMEVLIFLWSFTNLPKILRILAWPPPFQATIGKMGLLPVKLEFMEAPYTLSEPPPYAAVCVKIAFESCDSTK